MENKKKLRKVAIVPWDDSIKGDAIFVQRNDGYKGIHVVLAEAFNKNGIELHTIDMYKDLESVDGFLFFSANYKWYKKIMSKGLMDRALYCSAEPAVVVPQNTKEGYEQLLKLFGGILTWNYELVDNKRIFRRNIPFYFEKRFSEVVFGERKLVTSVSGNKTSNNSDELYSEREKVIRWFEKYHKDEFDFYGTGWDYESHPCYRGTVYDKCATYHNYKFAICFENTRNVKGYVTEKICDCLCSGIVPIYWGADDISLYVPVNCFIDFRKYSSMDELYLYLKSMHEDEYQKYIDAAKAYLDNPDDLFSTNVFYDEIVYAFENCQSDIKLNIYEKAYVYRKYVIQSIENKLLKIRISVSKFKRKFRK